MHLGGLEPAGVEGRSRCSATTRAGEVEGHRGDVVDVDLGADAADRVAVQLDRGARAADAAALGDAVADQAALGELARPGSRPRSGLTPSSVARRARDRGPWSRRRRSTSARLDRRSVSLVGARRRAGWAIARESDIGRLLRRRGHA